MTSQTESEPPGIAARVLALVLKIPSYLLYGWAVVAYAVGTGNPHISLPAGIFEWLAGLLVCVWVHELGHALAASLVRWHVIVFAARPFALHLVNRQIVRLRREDYQELGGFVFSIPRFAQSMTATRKALIVAGGPMANLLFGALMIGWASQGPGLELKTYLATSGFALGLTSLGVAWAALIPHKFGQYQSDGRSLWALLRHPGESEKILPLLITDAMSRYLVRLRDRPQWLDPIIRERFGEMDGIPQMLAAQHIGTMLDQADVDVAGCRAALDAFREQYGPTEWHGYCDIYLSAVWEGSEAGVLPDLRERETFLIPLRFAAEAAIAARSRDGATMKEVLRKMDAALAKKSPFADPTFRDIRTRIEAILA